jgi:hypothetical protein
LIKLIVERVYLDDEQVIALTLKTNYHLVLGHKTNEPTSYEIDPFISSTWYTGGDDGLRLRVWQTQFSLFPDISLYPPSLVQELHDYALSPEMTQGKRFLAPMLAISTREWVEIAISSSPSYQSRATSGHRHNRQQAVTLTARLTLGSFLVRKARNRWQSREARQGLRWCLFAPWRLCVSFAPRTKLARCAGLSCRSDDDFAAKILHSSIDTAPQMSIRIPKQMPK